MKKKNKFRIIEPVFQTSTLFLCGYSHEELGKLLKKEGVENLDVSQFEHAQGAQLFFRESNGSNSAFRCVWLREYNKRPSTISTAVHEIFHLVVRICDDKQVPIDRENNQDETGAYLMDFYTREFVGRLYGKSTDW